jgi:plasmid stabilization system protein ParE
VSDVDWTDRARDQLADIWVAATPKERVAFEGAIGRLERDLSEAPLEVGESRAGSVRVVIRSLLVFWFDVAPRVRIFRVTRFRRKVK